MAYQGVDDLFNDGWREPGDDCERLACYLLIAIDALAGRLAGWLIGAGAVDLTLFL